MIWGYPHLKPSMICVSFWDIIATRWLTIEFTFQKVGWLAICPNGDSPSIRTDESGLVNQGTYELSNVQNLCDLSHPGWNTTARNSDHRLNLFILFFGWVPYWVCLMFARWKYLQDKPWCCDSGVFQRAGSKWYASPSTRSEAEPQMEEKQQQGTWWFTPGIVSGLCLNPAN